MPSSPSATQTPLPDWEPDVGVKDCPLCSRTFGLFYRKHHCRKCGRVVCGNCCSNWYTLPSSIIVRPPDYISPGVLTPLSFLLDEDPADSTEEVRTCDGCFSRMEQDRCRRMLGLDMQRLDPRVAAQLIRESVTTPAVSASPPPSYSRTSVLSNTGDDQTNTLHTENSNRQPTHPAPNVSLTAERPWRRRRSTLGEYPSSSSAPTPTPRSNVNSARTHSDREDATPLRYVSFVMNEQDKMRGDECPICFEEYETGQKIARLECWCVYHLSCIRAWKSQKAGTTGCPLHFHD